MKRAVGLVLLGACAVWGVLLIDPRGGRDKSRSAEKTQQRADEEAEAEAAAPSAHAARPPTKSQHERPAEVEPKPATGSSPSSAAQPNGTGQGDVRVLGSQVTKPFTSATPAAQATTPAKTETQPLRGTGELGEGVMSPDFVELEGDYTQEPREGPWAIEHERKIRNFLYASEVGDHIVLVHCQSTVCRIHLEPHGDDPFGDLLRVPGLAEYADIDTSTPYSLNASELVVYSRPKEPVAATNPREDPRGTVK